MFWAVDIMRVCMYAYKTLHLHNLSHGSSDSMIALPYAQRQPNYSFAGSSHNIE